MTIATNGAIIPFALTKHTTTVRCARSPHPAANRLVQATFLIGFAMRKVLSILVHPDEAVVETLSPRPLGTSVGCSALLRGEPFLWGSEEMDKRDQPTCTAFEGFRRIASGELVQVALKTKKIIDRGEKGPILIFDDVTGEQIELDFRGTGSDVVNRIAKATSEQLPAAVSVEPAGEVPRGPGRPKLGVVARRSHFAAAALGLAQRSTRGCVGRAAKACGGGEARSTRARTAFGGHKSRLTGSCRRWPAICRDSRRQQGPYSPGKQILSKTRFAVGPRMFEHTLRGWFGRSCKSRCLGRRRRAEQADGGLLPRLKPRTVTLSPAPHACLGNCLYVG